MTDTNKIKILVFLITILGTSMLTNSLTIIVISGIITIVGFMDYDLDRKEREDNNAG